MRPRHHPRANVVSSVIVALLAACTAPPTHDATFAWAVVLANLDDALLSACGTGDQVTVVGGRGAKALVLESTENGWRTPPLPAGTGILWWCWKSPSGSVFAVGEHGTVLQRSFGRWRTSNTGIPANVSLFGVWGTGDENVLAVGGSPNATGQPPFAARYDGLQWSTVPIYGGQGQTLFKVWGSDSTSAWAVGTQGTILQFDGQQFFAVASPTSERLIAVSGRSAEDVYAVGGDGVGTILHYEGQQWQLYAQTPEPLAGVWTEAGRDLYVGGNRGYLARYPRSQAQNGSAPAFTAATAVDDVCMHAVVGVSAADEPVRLVAVGSDLFGGGVQSWRGALLSHRGQFGDHVEREPSDAAPSADAAIASDGGGHDGGIPDASVPLPVDATPPDAGWPGPGQPCGSIPAVCATDLECWQLLTSNVLICTENCVTAADCAAYGPDACCALPGFQTLQTVCIPQNHAECK